MPFTLNIRTCRYYNGLCHLAGGSPSAGKGSPSAGKGSNSINIPSSLRTVVSMYKKKKKKF